MFKSLLPKNDVFYELFDKISANTVEGVQTLVRMLDDCEHYNEHAVQLKSLEHQTDQLVHNVMSHLHKTFITPIEREDIHQLAGRLTTSSTWPRRPARALTSTAPAPCPARPRSWGTCCWRASSWSRRWSACFPT